VARVLVVEDDPDQLRVRRQLLEAGGHEVAGARTTADAARLLDVFLPQVLVTDLRLPSLEDGLELIRTTASRPAAPGIVVLSGWPEQLDGLPEAAQVDRVLAKPFRSAELLAAIRSLLLLLVCLLAVAAPSAAQSFRFEVSRPAEVVAEMEMSSPNSDWGSPGREAALAVLTLDSRAVQHVMLWAGAEPHTYSAFLGALEPGPHVLHIARHPSYSAAESGLRVHRMRFREVPPDDPAWLPLAHAPILYARADTVGRFTDIPLLAYCERLEQDGRPLLQYTIVFSNEDGGTSTRALMARWGRTTDIEYIYRAWLTPSGELERATIQGNGHREVEFQGRREGSHPLLIPATRNNMVAAEGASPIRYQLPPVLLDLSSASREEVMDRHSALYRVMAGELRREGKLRPAGPDDGLKISDPRNYLYIEMKLAGTGFASAAYVRLRGESIWRASHLGRPDYAIHRPGWVRTAIELPEGATPAQVEEIGFGCFVPLMKAPPQAGACRIEAVSKAFLLGSDYVPQPPLWQSSSPVEVPTGTMRVFRAGAPVRNPPSAPW
jgi:CheY-like chemotaxis protein